MQWLVNFIKQNEGYRRFAYVCSAGRLTIGYGTRIDHGGHGISEAVAEAALVERIGQDLNALSRLDWFMALDDVRQFAIQDMAYQMGVRGVQGFRKMIAALSVQDYETAADEVIDSLYARQTPGRAARIEAMIRSGQTE